MLTSTSRKSLLVLALTAGLATCLDAQHQEVERPEAWKGLAALSGSWIGGGANFLAIGKSIGVADSTLAMIVVIDVALANVWMAVLLFFSGHEERMDAAIGADRSSLDTLRKKIEMFQKEVALRLAARPRSKDYGRLSVLTQWLTEVRLRFDVPPRAFTPPPKVTSTVVGLVPPPLELTLDAFEVADAFEVPLAFFLEAGNRQRHSRVYQGRERHFFAYPYGERFIWGATAGMLSNLAEVLGPS